MAAIVSIRMGDNRALFMVDALAQARGLAGMHRVSCTYLPREVGR